MPTSPQPPSHTKDGASPRRAQSSSNGDDDEQIKVAVTVRCFMPHLNENDVLCVDLKSFDQGCKVTLKEKPDDASASSSSNPGRSFNFDYCFNQCSDDPAIVDRLGAFENQKGIYEKVGIPMLNSALEGRSSTVFAYGQTGSGKTYSMLGSTSDPERWGVIPRVCDRLFQTLEERKKLDDRNVYKVYVSVYEIYMETINDLLLPRDKWVEGGLEPKFTLEKHYEAPTSKHVVENVEEILKRVAFADSNRSVGEHRYNSRSSRAHTIYQVDFESSLVDEDEKITKSKCRLNLVDLAGAESSEKAGTSGLRREEGNKINKSLVTLGRVIRRLGQAKPGHTAGISFRESNLTLLLQPALTNGKITMIAAMSPSETKYQGSLATMLFASEVKKVVVRSKRRVEKSDADRLKEYQLMQEDLEGTIEALQRKLQAALESQKTITDTEEIDRLKAELELQRKQEEEAQEDYKRKLEELKEGGDELRAKLEEEIRKEFEENMKKGIGGAHINTNADKKEIVVPHMVNLSAEPELSERLTFILERGDNVIGRRDKNYPPKFTISGPGIVKRHCRLVYEADDENNSEKVFIEALDKNSRTFVNGDPITPQSGRVELFHWDRVWLGVGSVFRFQFPGNEMSMKPIKKLTTIGGDGTQIRASTSAYFRSPGSGGGTKSNLESSGIGGGMGGAAGRSRSGYFAAGGSDQAPDYFYAEAELIRKEKKRMIAEGQDTNVLSSAVTETFKKTETANIMASDMDADAFFRTKIISDIEAKHLTPVVIATLHGARFVWSKEKFEERFFLMSDLWQRFLRYQDEDRVDEFQLPPDDSIDNPFADNEPQLVGASRIFLAPLRNMIDAEMNPPLLTRFGTKEGLVQLSIVPLDEKGNEGPWDDENILDDPFREVSTDLLNDEIQFGLRIGRLQWNIDLSTGDKVKYQNVFARFKLNEDDIEEDWVESPPVKGSSLAPNINFFHKFNRVVDERFFAYLAKGSIRVEIWADPILQVNANPFNATMGQTMKPHKKLLKQQKKQQKKEEDGGSDQGVDEQDDESSTSSDDDEETKAVKRLAKLRAAKNGNNNSNMSASHHTAVSGDYECFVDVESGEETLRPVEVIPETEAGKSLVSGKNMPDGWTRVKVTAYRDPNGVVHLVPPSAGAATKKQEEAKTSNKDDDEAKQEELREFRDEAAKFSKSPRNEDGKETPNPIENNDGASTPTNDNDENTKNKKLEDEETHRSSGSDHDEDENEHSGRRLRKKSVSFRNKLEETAETSPVKSTRVEGGLGNAPKDTSSDWPF